MKNTRNVAVGLALSAAAISGLANFLNKIAVTVIKDAVVYTTLKNALVAVLLAGVIVALGKRKEIAALSRRQWIRLIAVGVVGGSLPFALFFAGLQRTSALNASLIHKTMFVWVILLAAPLLKEKLSAAQWLGAGAIFAANLVVGGFTGFKFNSGEMMILAATLLWAAENIIAKKVLADVSAVTVAASRMAVGSLVLLPFALAAGGAGAVAQLNAGQWGWTLLAAGLLFGYVVAWYSALKRLPASQVACLLVPATLVTNALTAAFVTHSFGWTQFVSAALLAAGLSAVVLGRLAKPAPTAAAAN